MRMMHSVQELVTSRCESLVLALIVLVAAFLRFWGNGFGLPYLYLPDESFLAMRELGAEIVFIPTFSPKRVESVEEKFKRDNDIFVRGARLSDALIVKVCSVRSEYRDFLQARSLIADKGGVIYRVQPEEEEKSMIIKQEVQL